MEQIIIASAALFLLAIGLLQSYQKSLEKSDVKEDNLRKQLYEEKVLYLRLKQKYDNIVIRYKYLLGAYNRLVIRHKNTFIKYKKLYIAYKNFRDK